MIKFHIKLTLPVSLLVITLGTLYFYDRQRPCNQARRVVDKHLSSLKTGKGNPYSTVNITKIREVFINVLDYKYLSIEKIKVPDGPMVFDKDDYQSFKGIHKTYEEYLNFWKELYGDKAKQVGDKLIVDRDSYHYEYEFLYDLVLTNKLGVKLYKKCTFRVAPDVLGGYKIVNYYER